MRVLIISETSSNIYTIQRFFEEGKNLGINVNHIRYSDVSLSFGETLEIKTDSFDLINDFDAFVFRNAAAVRIRYGHLTKVLMTLLKNHNKKIINLNKILRHSSNSVKIYEHSVMTNFGIPMVPTKLFANKESALKELEFIKFPIIAKPSTGSHGNGISVIKDAEEYKKYIKQTTNISEILFQKYITDPNNPRNEDIRVLTLGGTILGAYKRSADKSKIITNFSAGGKGETFTLNDETKRVVLSTIEAFEADFAGVDIIFDNGKPLVLEVNGAPQFEGFEKTTGINVAAAFLKYIQDELK